MIGHTVVDGEHYDEKDCQNGVEDHTIILLQKEEVFFSKNMLFIDTCIGIDPVTGKGISLEKNVEEPIRIGHELLIKNEKETWP